jgi:exosortase A-associated hydrolase 2
MTQGLHAFCHPATPGRRPGHRLYLHHRPDDTRPVRGCILHVHPFAEEMNKCRRMAALQARALAAAGWAVLQVDLYGCGDSAGDFGDATWDAWADDVAEAATWLHDQYAAPLWLWGVRAGALIASAALQRSARSCGLLLWNPVTSGRQVLQQFLRLKMAGALAEGRHKGIVETLRAQLSQGESIDIAGYRLHPGLAQGLEAATLAVPPAGSRVEWFEVQASESPASSPVAARTAKEWAAAGVAVTLSAVQGPAFWQSAEIEEAPDLLSATLEALDRPVRSGASHPILAGASGQ